MKRTSSWKRCKRFFDLEFLLRCVQASSLTRSAADLAPCIQACIRIACPDTAIQQHLLSMITAQTSIPSVSSLVRHRLTMHMGFCMWQQELRETLLEQPGGVVVWRMVDSSPQGGWDAVLHLYCVAPLEKLDSMLAGAHLLCDPAAQHDDKVLATQRLSAQLQWRQGTPTAVGSGRAIVPPL